LRCILRLFSMTASRITLGLVATVIVAGLTFARETESRAAILPRQFGGWQMRGAAQSSIDPAIADPTNVALLKEYGFTDFQSATYSRDDGRTLKIRAARFESTSGAIGAFTFYRQPEMQKEEIGDWGCSLNQRILFYRGNVLVDAAFDRVTVMSAAELRELAGLLPRPGGSAGSLPPILAYMPHQGRVSNTEKYVVGPAGLGEVDSPLPADLVNFNAGAEVVIGKYNTAAGTATLVVINYPTPQIAAQQLRKIDAAHRVAQPQPGVASVQDVGPFFDKRSGPLLAIAAGPLSPSEAQALLASVNYEADVTWNQNTYFDKRNNIANLLVNIIILCGILMGLALVAGFAFGGLRLLVKRIFPDKVFDRPEEMEFISLHLSEKLAEGAPTSPGPGSGTPKT